MPHGATEQKSYSRLRKHKEKGIITYHYRISLIHKERQQQWKEQETTKNPENNKMALVSP